MDLKFPGPALHGKNHDQSYDCPINGSCPDIDIVLGLRVAEQQRSGGKAQHRAYCQNETTGLVVGWSGGLIHHGSFPESDRSRPWLAVNLLMQQWRPFEKGLRNLL